ncbi:unnamed protein product [Caenorhabditis auriculariae]|uniref:Histone acetyltransferase n=1 Tax=Caenorhabditis auriculariae TaxID=2777116 RepID=A0A8S1HRY9_9PELO|nr:unnamed protein product [Caenorhabditis auriculariae]
MRVRKQKREDKDEPVVGWCYMVERIADGNTEKCLATIIHVEDRLEHDPPATIQRSFSGEHDLPASTPTTSKPAADANPTTENDDSSDEKRENRVRMYYVHYEMLDRRNDEWVPRERILEFVDSHAGAIIPDPPPSFVANCDQLRGGGALTRSQRRIHEEFNHLRQGFDTMDATTARLEKEHEERTKVKNIPRVFIGKYCITTWYYSPFPAYCNNQDLHMCEYCLLYTPSKDKYKIHRKSCKERQPPGNEIYRKDNLSVYEIDGSQNKLYCQCLCLLSKLFMDHKTLYFDVDDFMFYVLCEVNDAGAHIVGYFSKEVDSVNNLACIMVFPPFQNVGYGKFLIQLSYELSTREGYIGTPEKPLSDLGKVSYRSYWWWILLSVMSTQRISTITAFELSLFSGVAVDDIVSTLGTMKMVRQWKDGEYVVRSSRRFVEHCLAQKLGKPPKIMLDPSSNHLRWQPSKTRNETEMLREAHTARDKNAVIYAYGGGWNSPPPAAVTTDFDVVASVDAPQEDPQDSKNDVIDEPMDIS